MEKVIYKLPNKNVYNKFRQYLLLKDCSFNDESLIVTCRFDAIELKIATLIFNAIEVVTVHL